MNTYSSACVAIVGRPNVGKSSLLNRLAGRRIAIVDPMSGVTRDRITARVKMGDRFIEVVDTGGIGIVDQLQLEDEVEHQIAAAVGQGRPDPVRGGCARGNCAPWIRKWRPGCGGRPRPRWCW